MSTSEVSRANLIQRITLSKHAKHYLTWLLWSVLTLFMCGYFGYALLSEESTSKTVLLPGETTHGHYQIEMKCNACHTPMMGVKQDACTSCHEAELKLAKDTHPAKKFNDPTNASRLEIIDAKKCITCHKEHVPDQTCSMGLTVPKDYCFHCHQDIAEQRPSHEGFEQNTCSTSGCHNYHDNRALYENFLYQHADEPDTFPADQATVPELSSSAKTSTAVASLTIKAQDAPKHVNPSRQVLHDWVDTAHAKAGINCRECHQPTETVEWKDQVDHQACNKCHEFQVTGFLEGRHGMRLAQGLSAMTVKDARLPMKHGSFHQELSCSSCHDGHRFDTKQAAVNACLKCHDDQHTKSYQESKHYSLWLSELSGDLPKGSGVSCATCHMPRTEHKGKVVVQHNQNDNLRPNEKMIRSTCMNCHGLDFTINALADQKLIDHNFSDLPSVDIESIEMVKQWFEAKEKKRKQRQNK